MFRASFQKNEQNLTFEIHHENTFEKNFITVDLERLTPQILFLLFSVQTQNENK